MRVMTATWQPGKQDAAHGHPTTVVYALTDVSGVEHAADGSQTPIRLKAGSVLVQDGVSSHSFQNDGQSPARMLLVEIKPGAKPSAMPDGARDPQLASPEIYELLALDTRVRVLRATWQPGQKDELHGHPALVAYAITDITGQLTSKDGTVKPVKIKAGSALLEPPIPGHTFENLGTEPAQLLLVEARK
jgi:quercetin dioxygenase-like cupin family protein